MKFRKFPLKVGCLFKGGVSVHRYGGNDEKDNCVVVDYIAGGLQQFLDFCPGK